MGGREIELKLALAPEAVAKFKHLKLLTAHRQGRASSASLRSVYFDTPTQTLAKAGITVRLRSDGSNGGLVQTVKTAGSRASGLFSRQEWETAVGGPDPDAEQLAATGLAPLQDEAVCQSLAPIFATDVQRTLYLLAGEDWRLELALDVGEVRAGERREPICEAELELKDGEPAHLFALARQLADQVPVRLMATSKSDRGHTLAAGREPAAVKARPVELSADMPLAEAFRAVARNCLHHLLANERALLAHGDGEAVHQMRVALRRLRSALKVFRPLVDGPQLNALKEEVRWLLDLLGPARDAEVFLAEIIDPVVKGLPDRTGLSTLRDHWRAERQADLEAARQAVENRRFTLLLLDLGAWVEAGDWSSDAALPGFAHRNDALGPFARGVLDRLARKLHKAGGRHLAALAPPDLHQVRIHGKRLRYAGEFFAPLHAKSEAKAYLGALADLQDRLGEINDIAVAGPRLAGCHHLGDAAWAAGLVTGWHEARRPALIAAADELWTDFRKVRKFWRKG